jgi:hypothetical protein
LQQPSLDDRNAWSARHLSRERLARSHIQATVGNACLRGAK